MMSRIALLALLALLASVAACASHPRPPAHSPSPTKPAETDSPVEDEIVGGVEGHAVCTYGYYELAVWVPPSEQRANEFADANDRARAANAAGKERTESGHFFEAARDFVACAKAFKAIADEHPQRPMAQKAAEYCVENAIHAYQNAGRIADGARVLRILADDDVRLKPLIDKKLAGATDCKVAP